MLANLVMRAVRHAPATVKPAAHLTVGLQVHHVEALGGFVAVGGDGCLITVGGH